MQKVLQVKRGEVYLAHLYGIGSEQRGKRPVVILQNDVGNLHSPTTLIAPLTSSTKKHNLPVHIKVRNNHLYQNSTVLLEQVQVLDKSRLHKKLCKLNDKEMAEINKALSISFAVGENNGGNN